MNMSEELLKKVISRIDELRDIEGENHYKLNLLSILGKETEEVAMCKVLWAILDYNTNGERCYLRSFIHEVLKTDINDEELQDASVYREYYIPVNNRRIDLVIKTKSHFIPIEAKIYAGDQNEQCIDYLSYTRGYYKNSQDAILFYLTLDKHRPSYNSISGNEKILDQIRLISWRDINLWLDSVKSVCEATSEVIGQYQKALDLILDEKKGQFDMQIKDMIDSPDGIKAAIEIENAFAEKKVALMEGIYDEIISRISMEGCLDYDPRLNQPWDYKKGIKEYYLRRQSSSTYPALTYNLGLLDTTASGDEYYFIIRYEIEWYSYVGLAIMRRDKEGDLFSENNPSKDLVNKAKEMLKDPDLICQTKKSWWLYWEYITSNNQDKSNNEPDFRNMNDAYISLYSDRYRSEYINQVVDMLLKFKSFLK